jgi:integrase
VAKKNLTDRTLKALRPAKAGKHYDVFDVRFPGFGVRVADTGRLTFVLTLRYPGSKNPTRRALGRYPALSLEQARAKASEWVALVEKGIDPAIEAERQRVAELRRQENSFASVAEDFIRDKLASERKGREVARDIRRVFIKAWGRRPITDISALEVRAVIKGFKDRGKPYQAHNMLGYARRLFNWAFDQHVYGLEASPCDRLKPKSIVGEKASRTRVLTDAEWRALWNASESLGYPYGPLFCVLALTGQRRSEVAESQWSEFDLDKRLWVIPTERMKADAAHIVPLTDDALAILKGLPRFSNGDYLFSLKSGRSPVQSFNKAKRNLDAAMAKKLGGKLSPFVLHDIRRSMRTGLSALPVPDLIRELVIGHTKPGLHRVYDQYAYVDEKRHALELWAKRLRDIVTPPPPNVIDLGKARA